MFYLSYYFENKYILMNIYQRQIQRWSIKGKIITLPNVNPIVSISLYITGIHVPLAYS